MACGRLLAEAVTRYVAELEQLAANRESRPIPAAASGQAA